MADTNDFWQPPPPSGIFDDGDDDEGYEGSELAPSAFAGGVEDFAFSMVDGCQDLDDLTHSIERHLDPSYVVAWHLRVD